MFCGENIKCYMLMSGCAIEFIVMTHNVNALDFYKKMNAIVIVAAAVCMQYTYVLYVNKKTSSRRILFLSILYYGVNSHTLIEWRNQMNHWRLQTQPLSSGNEMTR